MNWKEFLKPTDNKTAIAFAIFFLFMPWLQFSNGTACAPCPKGAVCAGTCPDHIIGSFGLMLLFFAATGIFSIQVIIFEVLLIGLVLSYLLACLIAYIYPKYAKKAKK